MVHGLNETHTAELNNIKSTMAAFDKTPSEKELNTRRLAIQQDLPEAFKLGDNARIEKDLRAWQQLQNDLEDAQGKTNKKINFEQSIIIEGTKENPLVIPNVDFSKMTGINGLPLVPSQLEFKNATFLGGALGQPFTKSSFENVDFGGLTFKTGAKFTLSYMDNVTFDGNNVYQDLAIQDSFVNRVKVLADQTSTVKNAFIPDNMIVSSMDAQGGQKSGHKNTVVIPSHISIQDNKHTSHLNVTVFTNDPTPLDLDKGNIKINGNSHDGTCHVTQLVNRDFSYNASSSEKGAEPIKYNPFDEQHKIPEWASNSAQQQTSYDLANKSQIKEYWKAYNANQAANLKIAGQAPASCGTNMAKANHTMGVGSDAESLKTLPKGNHR